MSKILPGVSKVAILLLPLVWIGVVGISLAESYFYPGVLQKHLLIDPLFIYIVYGLIGLFCLYKSEWKSNLSLMFFRKLNYFAMYVFAIVYYFFYVLQRVTYPNYVFSKFHINPVQLAIPLGISVFGYLVSSKNILISIFKTPKLMFRWFSVFIIFVIIFMQNFLDLGINIWQDVSFIINNPNASYDQKMEYKLGKQFYDYTLFIKRNTPENSSILLPPFPANPWPQSGNIPYMTYFLFPRKLFNGNEYDSKFDLKKDNIDYVLLDWGEMPAGYDNYTNGWPKFNVSSSEIIYWNGGDKTEIKNGDYVYDNVKDRILWGVIKVKK